MLAYMDEILESDDAEDIGKKIEESELAKTVMHRTRDAMRRLRLGAPAVNGRGMGVDPNSVAEYLDNTLPPEQVPDFERVCLESEVHLAEVGACHQILTLVLGEPAEVDPMSRERMYQLVSHAHAAVAVQETSPEAIVSPPIEAPPVDGAAAEIRVQAAKRAKPEVPDYLREPRSHRWQMAAAILALAAIGGIASVIYWPQVQQMVAGVWGEGNVTPSEPDNAAPFSPEKRPGQEDDDAARDPQAEESAENEPGAASDRSGDGMRLPPGGPELPRPRGPAADAGPDTPGPEEMVGDVDDPNAGLPTGDGTNSLPATLPGDDDMAGPDDALPVRAGPVDPRPGILGNAAAGAVPTVDPADDVPADALGRYLYKQDVLLRFDRREKAWRRLPPMASLSTGDRLMALPLFRPAIPLSTGVTIQPVDASVFEILGLDENGVPRVALDFGRLILFTAGKPRNQIRIRSGDREGLITFGDGESTMAIEVRRLPVPGKDPMTDAEPLAVDLFATSGDITWQEDGLSLALKAPAHKVLSSISGEPGTDLPKWTHGEPLTPSEARGAAELDKQLSIDRPVSLSLKELSEDRRAEVRSFATRCAAYLDNFEPFVTALNDQGQRLSWTNQIETLKAAMARGPETAQKVLASFEKHRGADAPELYRMLCGYTPQQLADGAAAKLVEYLNHDSLDFRVLAFHNLREITGKSLYYVPYYPPAKRKKEFAEWKKKLKNGEIVPVVAAAPQPVRPAAPKTGVRPPVEPSRPAQ
jgi:hypothetical protein